MACALLTEQGTGILFMRTKTSFYNMFLTETNITSPLLMNTSITTSGLLKKIRGNANFYSPLNQLLQSLQQ